MSPTKQSPSPFRVSSFSLSCLCHFLSLFWGTFSPASEGLLLPVTVCSLYLIRENKDNRKVFSSWLSRMWNQILRMHSLNRARLSSLILLSLSRCFLLCALSFHDAISSFGNSKSFLLIFTFKEHNLTTHSFVIPCSKL